MERSERIKALEEIIYKWPTMFKRDGLFLLSEVKRYREALEEVAGLDCANENLFTKEICGVCLTCNARKSLSDDEVTG